MVDWRKLGEKPYKPLAELSRRVAADGAVLLKNKGDVLPITSDRTVSVFGRTQINYNKCGTGSGGAVHTEYTVNILDGILNNDKININTELAEVYKEWIKSNPFDSGDGWVMPWAQTEMVPSENIVKAARAKSDTAVIVIGRTAGEDRDSKAEKGSWYLTDEEEALLEVVSKHFEKTAVLLNVGNIMDMNWVDKYDIKAVLYIWQGGQEGGNAVADLLCGSVSPGGRLSDTIAYDISDYPSNKNFGSPECNIYSEDIYVGYRYFETFAKDRVMYPFGFGLSYTSFESEVASVSENGGTITLKINIKNTGKRAGRDVVQVYFEAPQGQLGKSARELCGFAKTGITEPGEIETLEIKIKVSALAAYDDSGVTGNKSCYVLESGDYNLYVGSDVRGAKKVFTYHKDETTVTEKLSEAAAPEFGFEVLCPKKTESGYEPSYKSVSVRTVDYKKRIAENLPAEIPFSGDKGIKLTDVKCGRNSIDEFVAQLSDADLRCIVTGEGMSSPKARPGSTGVFGGVTAHLADMGIPVVALCDGPSGIRMDNGDTATSMPSGTLIACTWDEEAAEKLYENVSIELCTHHFDSLLGPGMNIHRHPLNGRNFEYMSEDPFLTGKICAALVRGAAVYGNSATIKHFAANNQEFKRSNVNAAVSERALREIYLKGFEIAVKEGKAKSLMTSYNPINGHWSALNYDLNTVILRDEWKYDGVVMTDWWPTLSKEPSEYKNLKEMVEAQNDVFMLAADALTFKSNIEQGLEDGTLTRGQLQRCAKNILRYAMNTHSFDYFIENGGKLNFSLASRVNELKTVSEYKELKENEEMDIKIDGAGKYLYCIECTADGEELAQYSIRIYLDNVCGPMVNVKGAQGKKTTAYLDYTFKGDEKKMRIQFPPAIKIHSVKIMH